MLLPDGVDQFVPAAGAPYQRVGLSYLSTTPVVERYLASLAVTYSPPLLSDQPAVTSGQQRTGRVF